MHELYLAAFTRLPTSLRRRCYLAEQLLTVGSMTKLTEWMDRTLYPTFDDNWDDIAFRQIIESYLRPEYHCLDYGAGRGKTSQMNFHDMVEFVAGVDPDDVVKSNPYLHEAKVLDLSTHSIPYADNSFDVVYSANVMEHIQDTDAVFREINRVLKPGGRFLAKTPNKWHYVAAIARTTPLQFHKFYNAIRGRKTTDTFPTLYKCNSRRDVVKYAARNGFKVKDIRLIEGRPEYLRISSPTYACGFIYERFVNATDMLSSFRCVLTFVLEKENAS